MSGPEVCPEVTIRPPGRSDLTEWPQVASPTVSMTPSTFSGSRCAGLEDLVRTDLQGPRALGLVAAGGEDPQAAGPGQGDRGGGHPAAGALDEHRVAGP